MFSMVTSTRTALHRGMEMLSRAIPANQGRDCVGREAFYEELWRAADLAQYATP